MLKTSDIYDMLTKEPSVVLYIGPRGSGKTFSSTYFLEDIVEEGWKVVLFDLRGEDKGIHKPNTIFEDVLSRYGLKPKGYSANFFTFRWPDGMEEVPENYELEPVSIKNVRSEDFDMLVPIITRKDIELLAEAIAAMGGSRRATMDGLITFLYSMRDKVSFRLLRFIANGLIDDISQLEPKRLLESDKQFTVISAGFSGIRNLPVQLWGLREVALGLLDYVATRPVFDRVMIWFREIAPIAPRSGGRRAEWHTSQLLKQMILSFRELGGTQTRIGVEAQYPRLLPTYFLTQATLMFVSPLTLKSEKELRDIENNFTSIPDRVIEALSDKSIYKPGVFFAISKSGDYALIRTPPPRSFRPPKAKDADELQRMSELIREVIPTRKVSKELRDVDIRFKKLVALFKSENVNEPISYTGLLEDVAIDYDAIDVETLVYALFPSSVVFIYMVSYYIDNVCKDECYSRRIDAYIVNLNAVRYYMVREYERRGYDKKEARRLADNVYAGSVWKVMKPNGSSNKMLKEIFDGFGIKFAKRGVAPSAQTVSKHVYEVKYPRKFHVFIGRRVVKEIGDLDDLAKFFDTMSDIVKRFKRYPIDKRNQDPVLMEYIKKRKEASRKLRVQMVDAYGEFK